MSELTPKRRARVNRIKKIIVISNFLIMFILLSACIFLAVRVIMLKKEVKSTEEKLQAEKSVKENCTNGPDTDKEPDSADNDEKNTDEYIEVTDPEEIYEMVAYLTFDDGPSGNTYNILDILDRYNVKATFFVNGKDEARWDDEYKAIAERGHSIGMHSYEHVYSNVYESLESFSKDTERIHSFIQEKTGVDTRLYRFPGGSSTTKTTHILEYIEYLKENGYEYYDWNVSGGDAVKEALSVDTIVSNVMNGVKGKSKVTILMHDEIISSTTVEALPIIIENLQEEGYVLLPIIDTTTPVHHTVN